MELPLPLRAAVDRALDGVALVELKRAADRLSQRYRAELRDGRLHLTDDLAARAYLATRLPATYAAVRAAMDAVARAHPDFAPTTLLDVGAGPGTALWAAADCWPDLDDALLLEASPAIRAVGEELARGVSPPRVSWRSVDVAVGLPDGEARDLVTLAYVLDELSEEARDRLVDGLWARTADTLLIVEPGTPAGWARIRRARERLLGAGAQVLAPCAHAAACPVRAPDWCHFARRVARSRLHRQAKGGEVPWEDEKFSYVAVSRRAGRPASARILVPPRGVGNGRIAFRLCAADGRVVERVLAKRDGALFKAARRLGWGDALPPAETPESRDGGAAEAGDPA